MYQERRRLAPVSEGDELDVKIEAVGEKGDGIARKQGFVLFIAGTKSGDEVRVRVTKVLKNAGFAEVIAKQEKKAAPVEEDFSDENDTEDFGEAEEETEKPSDADDSYDENEDR